MLSLTHTLIITSSLKHFEIEYLGGGGETGEEYGITN